MLCADSVRTTSLTTRSRTRARRMPHELLADASAPEFLEEEFQLSVRQLRVLLSAVTSDVAVVKLLLSSGGEKRTSAIVATMQRRGQVARSVVPPGPGSTRMVRKHERHREGGHPYGALLAQYQQPEASDRSQTPAPCTICCERQQACLSHDQRLPTVEGRSPVVEYVPSPLRATNNTATTARTAAAANQTDSIECQRPARHTRAKITPSEIDQLAGAVDRRGRAEFRLASRVPPVRSTRRSPRSVSRSSRDSESEGRTQSAA